MTTITVHRGKHTSHKTISIENHEGESPMTGSSNTATTNSSNPDVVLIGAGIMSATLAVILKELDPELKIEIHEVLGSEAQESSNAWNNAGTGHAALCELNYTPQRADGGIDISKALQVNTEFDLSRQLWGLSGDEGSDKGSSVVPSSRTSHEFRARGR
jgi:L-2-hydroxyglutarate oxidase LhgO